MPSPLDFLPPITIHGESLPLAAPRIGSMPMAHFVKCEKEHFNLKSFLKCPSTVRKMDRDYRCEDQLFQFEFDSRIGSFSGRYTYGRIHRIYTHLTVPGITSGYGIIYLIYLSDVSTICKEFFKT